MLRKQVFFVTVLCFALGIASVQAAQSPVNTLNRVVQQVVGALKRHKARLKTNPRVVYDVINRYLLPHVDVQRMSRSVVGYAVWKKTTANQRKRFSAEFTRLVVRTYASALADFDNETVRFDPRVRWSPNRQSADVRSVIVRQNGQNIGLDYSVVLVGNRWKIYDLRVEGVSLLESFRAQFASELSQGTFEQLITMLAKHNSRGK